MLIDACLAVVLGILQVLLSPFQMMLFPASVASKVLVLLDYLAQGSKIVRYFTHWTYISSLLVFILAMNVFINAYHFIMWALKKIPFINIK